MILLMSKQKYVRVRRSMCFRYTLRLLRIVNRTIIVHVVAKSVVDIEENSFCYS